MYIFQQNFNTNRCNNCDSRKLLLVVSGKKTKFENIVKSTINDLNCVCNDVKWKLEIINEEDENKSLDQNYNAILNSVGIIADIAGEAQNHPDIFYLIGIAHASGVSVCACYQSNPNGDTLIPFNVQGRQTIDYSFATIDEQKLLKKSINEWIKLL